MRGASGGRGVEKVGGKANKAQWLRLGQREAGYILKKETSNPGRERSREQKLPEEWKAYPRKGRNKVV